MRPRRVLTDSEQSEQIPLTARLAARSTYELLRAAAEKAPEHRALCCASAAKPAHQPVSLTYGVLLGKLHQTANLLADLGGRRSGRDRLAAAQSARNPSTSLGRASRWDRLSDPSRRPA